MKAKLIILAAIAAVLLHSCSGDRDNENLTPTSEKTIRPENFKLKNKGESNKTINDSIIVKGLKTPEDLYEDPVVDPTKPDKPW